MAGSRRIGACAIAASVYAAVAFGDRCYAVVAPGRFDRLMPGLLPSRKPQPSPNRRQSAWNSEPKALRRNHLAHR